MTTTPDNKARSHQTPDDINVDRQVQFLVNDIKIIVEQAKREGREQVIKELKIVFDEEIERRQRWATNQIHEGISQHHKGVIVGVELIKRHVEQL